MGRARFIPGTRRTGRISLPSLLMKQSACRNGCRRNLRPALQLPYHPNSLFERDDACAPSRCARICHAIWTAARSFCQQGALGLLHPRSSVWPKPLIQVEAVQVFRRSIVGAAWLPPSRQAGARGNPQSRPPTGSVGHDEGSVRHSDRKRNLNLWLVAVAPPSPASRVSPTLKSGDSHE